MNYFSNTYIEVNLDNLIYNLKFVKDNNKDKEIIAVVKDDAYGHGCIQVSRELIKNGVKILAVGNLIEAIYLRNSGIKVPILIFGVTSVNYIDELINYDLIQSITSVEYANMIIEKLKKINKVLKVHLKLETGMGRVGLFASDENLEIVNNIFRNPLLDIQGIYSHFSDADNMDRDYTINQYKIFSSFCNNIDKLKLNIRYKHICNSAGSLNYQFNDVTHIRPGLLLYGYNMANEIDKLKPVMTLKAKIVHIKKVKKGECIGYSRTYRTQRESIIGTLNIGYGYGYPRYLSNKGKVIVNNEFANIVGNICMDHCMIDITNIRGVNLFDDAILIGESEDKAIDAHEIANHGNTICYEVLCGIRRRIPRIYLENNKVKYIREGYV